MFEKIIELDKHLLIFLNNLGSLPFDPFWLLITKQSSWILFFILLAYLVQKNIGRKQLGVVIIFIALILLSCNTIVEFCKVYFERLRPCNDPSVQNIIRVVHYSKSYSFFSGHAANSTATMVFLFLILKKYYNNAFLIFLYPLIFAYSRIYLGVHFPGDIITGFIVGSIFGLAFYKIFKLIISKYFKQPSI